MNRLEKLRELRKTSLTLTMGEGDDKFDVEIPLPTPYETQEIILSKTIFFCLFLIKTPIKISILNPKIRGT